MIEYIQAGKTISKPSRKSRISNIIVVRGVGGAVGRGIASATARTAGVGVLLLGKTEDYHVSPDGMCATEDYHVSPDGMCAVVSRSEQPALFHSPIGFFSRGDYDSLRK